MRNMNVLKVALPLAVAFAGGIAVSEAVDPNRGQDPVTRAGAICPAKTELIVDESHRLLSKAEVVLRCRDASGETTRPLDAGQPGIRDLDHDIAAAPPTTLYLTYKPGEADPPLIGVTTGDMPYDVLQLSGARSIVSVSFKEP